ncbi:MAG: hypothetical protein HOE75_01525 [Chloroflexi bacterium]|jgi:hypothetical protein|nr:hypothetical protein [Chloroflexota bacterium]
MSEPLKHRAICHDDEGRLECVCELRKGLDHRQAELLSRAEADRLVEQNSLIVMAAVMGAMR